MCSAGEKYLYMIMMYTRTTCGHHQIGTLCVDHALCELSDWIKDVSKALPW